MKIETPSCVLVFSCILVYYKQVTNVRNTKVPYKAEGIIIIQPTLIYVLFILYINHNNNFTPGGSSFAV